LGGIEQERMNSMNFYGILAVAMGLILTQRPAHAAIQNFQHSSNPARACQMSVPTTDSKIRPKAIGYRNEGTMNQFVICGLDNLDFGTWDIYFGIGFTSMDGMAHTVTCTGVTGVSGISVMPLQYSTFTVGVPASGYVQKSWNAGDFGGSSGQEIPGSFAPSITCNLPPNTAIIYLYEYSSIDTGA
jgi:hypothetical protein